MMGWFWSGMHGYGVTAMVTVTVALGALAAVFVLLTASGSRARTAKPSTARDVLDERYARGEIDDEEYQHRRQLLGQ